MTRLPKSFWHAWRRDFGASVATTGFIFVWVIFSIFIFAMLDHAGFLTETTGGIFFLVFGIGGAGLFGTLIQRALARRAVPHCPQCGASLSMYLNKRKQYTNVIQGKCPECKTELSQQEHPQVFPDPRAGQENRDV